MNDIAQTDRADPFRIVGPAVISFSGGRTSAYMLWRILQAHDGVLPPGVRVVFANTGKERPETLRFVHDCSVHWNVHIDWVEWRAGDSFEVVNFNSASRNGEPFAALIAKKQRLPNWQERWCTEELKVRTLQRFLISQGWEKWLNIVGLRYDEKARVAKQWEKNAAVAKQWQNNASAKSPWINEMPLYHAKVTKPDVMAFWSQQEFDLQLGVNEGNCDACFLKGKSNLKSLIRARPGDTDWWIEQEQLQEGTFSSRYSYADLLQQVMQQPDLFFMPDEPVEYDAECGDTCAVEEEPV